MGEDIYTLVEFCAFMILGFFIITMALGACVVVGALVCDAVWRIAAPIIGKIQADWD